MENIERMKPSQTYEVMVYGCEQQFIQIHLLKKTLGNTLRFCKRKIHKRQRKFCLHH